MARKTIDRPTRAYQQFDNVHSPGEDGHHHGCVAMCRGKRRIGSELGKTLYFLQACVSHSDRQHIGMLLICYAHVSGGDLPSLLEESPRLLIQIKVSDIRHLEIWNRSHCFHHERIHVRSAIHQKIQHFDPCRIAQTCCHQRRVALGITMIYLHPLIEYPLYLIKVSHPSGHVQIVHTDNFFSESNILRKRKEKPRRGRGRAGCFHGGRGGRPA
ncbi:hypothetical protein OKA04_10150 [Luteolibacter flavescens]|uniref:Uncharacterized protein n=1 Tax=Luteolibacter flavescens TaxID=1859460 RepID=A0ABT3FP20_9BACT|nr:hypothetical protein [Luteolibacter flavescens]MCW1885089.1 hypothetical protein [Luteolibacter flavescens]